MNLRKASILFAFLILIGCGQSDSDGNSPGDEQVTTDNNQTEMSAGESKDPTEPEETGDVVARVNGTPIYKDDANDKTLQFAIAEEIIYQAGIKQGVDKEYEDKIKEFEKRVIIDATKEKIIENTGPSKDISEEEIERYYELNKDKYTHTRISEISFPDAYIGEEIRKKAMEGEELQAIAASYPDVAVNVVDLGYNKQLAVTEFDKNEVGAVSEVVQKPNGTFRVLKIVEVKEIPLSASRKSIKFALESIRKKEAIENYASKFASENNIEIEIVGQKQSNQ
jgi:hypothetical protein